MTKWHTIIGLTLALFGVVPTISVNAEKETDFSADVAQYRLIARSVIADDVQAGADVPDQIEIAVCADSKGNCVIFPDCNGDVYYCRSHVSHPREGDVVAFAEYLDGWGEVNDIEYYVIDTDYESTGDMVELYHEQCGKFPF